LSQNHKINLLYKTNQFNLSARLGHLTFVEDH